MITIVIDIPEEGLAAAADSLEHKLVTPEVYEEEGGGIETEAVYQSDEDALKDYLISVIQNRVSAHMLSQAEEAISPSIKEITDQIG